MDRGVKDVNGHIIKKGDRVIVRDRITELNTLVTVEGVVETGDSLTSGVLYHDIMHQKQMLLSEEYYLFRIIEIPTFEE